MTAKKRKYGHRLHSSLIRGAKILPKCWLRLGFWGAKGELNFEQRSSWDLDKDSSCPSQASSLMPGNHHKPVSCVRSLRRWRPLPAAAEESFFGPMGKRTFSPKRGKGGPLHRFSTELLGRRMRIRYFALNYVLSKVFRFFMRFKFLKKMYFQHWSQNF